MRKLPFAGSRSDPKSSNGKLARRVGQVTYRAVRREHNVLADQLVNDALDAVAARNGPSASR